jgi:hypothetical protein
MPWHSEGVIVCGCIQQVVSRLLGDLRESIAQTRRPGISFDEFRNFFLLLPRNEMLVDYFVSARCPAICDIGACAVVNRDDTPQVQTPGTDESTLGVHSPCHLHKC